MVVLLALSLLAQPAPGLQVDTLRPDGGPRLLVHHRAGPVVALRLSVPIPTGMPEGAVELVQELVRDDAQQRAARIGATLDIRRETRHAVMRVAGPATALDELVTLLRRATAEPLLGTAGLARARARAEERVSAWLERPRPRLRALLDARLDRAPAPAGFAAAALEPEGIRDLMRRLYPADAMQVVVVGDVPAEVLAAAFARWPEAPGGSPAAPAEPVPPPAPQVLGTWAALGYSLQADPATTAVAAALVDRRVRRSALRWGGAEAWPAGDGAVLVVLGGAAPGDPAIAAAAASARLPGTGGGAGTETARYLRRMVAEARALAGPSTVAAAALELRRALLLEARTPAGRAEVVGRFADLSWEVDTLLSRLVAVDPAAVVDVLDAALAMPPVLVEIDP